MTVFPTVDPTHDVWGQQLKDWLDENIAALTALFSGSPSLSAINTWTAEQRFADGPWVDVTADPYGAAGDGITLDQAAIEAAIVAGQGKTLFFPAGLTFLGTDNIFTDFSGVLAVIAWGATFHQFRPLIGDDCDWFGGTFDEDTGTSSKALMRVAGSNVNLHQPKARGLAHAYTGIEILNTVARPEVVNILQPDISCRSGVTCFASRAVSVAGPSIETNGDDGIVLKDTDGQGCDDFTASDVRATNCASILAVGTQVKPIDVDHPNAGVRNVNVGVSVATNCSRLIYIKPGHASYTGGLVEGVTAKVRGRDLIGTAMQSPVAISIDYASTVRNVNIDVDFEGRFTTAGGTPVHFVYVTVDGLSTIDGLKITGRLIDRYDGAANDGSHPGNPPTDGVHMEKLGTGGTINDVDYSGLRMDGMGRHGFLAFADDGNLFIDAAKVFHHRTVTGSGKVLSLSSDAAVTNLKTDSAAANLVSTTGILHLVMAGNGSPEGVVVAGIGSQWRRKDGGAATSLYVKEANNTTNAGWAAK